MVVSRETRTAIALLGDRVAEMGEETARGEQTATHARKGGLRFANALHDLIVCTLVDFENIKRRKPTDLKGT